MKRPTSRRVLAAVLAVLVLVLAAAWGVRTILAPSTDHPGRSDAVVVLGASWPWRTAVADQLMASGAAKALVVSAHPADTLGDPPVPCKEAARRPYPVYCFDPDPSTTQGEARAIARLATEHGWHSIQVVTFRPQVARARVLLGRCFDGEVHFIDSHESYSNVDQVIYQAGAFLKVAASRGC